MNDEYMESHLIDFAIYWGKMGLRSPNRYIEAPGILALGLYYPWKTYPEVPNERSNIYHSYAEYSVVDAAGIYSFPEDQTASLHRYANIDFLDHFFDGFIKNQGWSRVPLFRVIWSGAFTTFLFIFCICFISYKKQYKYLVPISLTFGLILTVFLAPVVLFRYIFPVVLTMPIMLYCILNTLKTKNTNNKNEKNNKKH